MPRFSAPTNSFPAQLQGVPLKKVALSNEIMQHFWEQTVCLIIIRCINVNEKKTFK